MRRLVGVSEVPCRRLPGATLTLTSNSTQPTPMSPGRMLRAGQLAVFPPAPTHRTVVSAMGTYDPDIAFIISALKTAQVIADRKREERAQRSAAQESYTKKVEDIRERFLAVIAEYDASIKNEGNESFVDDGTGRVPIGDTRYDHIATWTFGAKAEPFTPLASVTVAIGANDDLTDGDLLIFTQTEADYSPEEAAIVRNPQFKSTVSDIVNLILGALCDVEEIHDATEAKVGVFDERLTVAVLQETARRITLYAAVAFNAQAVNIREKVMAYDLSMAKTHILKAVRVVW